MMYTIHAQDDRMVDVTIDDEAGLSIRKKMDLQPYGVDEIVSVPHPENEGEFILCTRLKLVDPFDDLSGFFAKHLEAYKRGKQVEEDAKAPKQKLDEPIYFVPQEPNSEEAAAE